MKKILTLILVSFLMINYMPSQEMDSISVKLKIINLNINELSNIQYRSENRKLRFGMTGATAPTRDTVSTKLKELREEKKRLLDIQNQRSQKQVQQNISK